MHFEVHIEDISGKKMIEILFEKLLPPNTTFNIKAYKGLGGIQSNQKRAKDIVHTALLNNLPRVLRGYGKTYTNSNYEMAIIVVCDLDDKDLTQFTTELNNILNECNPKPNAYFCFAIEEGEAWLLGDINAIKKAYPKAKENILKKYVNDSICGTWELLADAIHSGGLKELLKNGPVMVGTKKSEWAEKITPFMDINNNKSPSFKKFKTTIEKLIK